MNSKPYTVITSRTAKDHLGSAKVLMNEVKQGMLMQQQKIQQQQQQTQQVAREDQQTQIANEHEIKLQRDKLMGVAMLQ